MRFSFPITRIEAICHSDHENDRDRFNVIVNILEEEFGSEDKTARLWDLQGNIVLEFKRHTSSIHSVAFSPDGKTILTGASDDTIRVWNLLGNLIQEYKGHTQSVYPSVFSPDGKTILSGAGDGTAFLWKFISLEDFLKKENLEVLTKEQKLKYGIDTVVKTLDTDGSAQGTFFVRLFPGIDNMAIIIGYSHKCVHAVPVPIVGMNIKNRFFQLNSNFLILLYLTLLYFDSSLICLPIHHRLYKGFP